MTTAEQIADAYANDGQCFSVDGVDIGEACYNHEGFETYHVRGPFLRYTFTDGSALTIGPESWDIGYPDCWCWRGARHMADCEARA